MVVVDVRVMAANKTDRGEGNVAVYIRVRNRESAVAVVRKGVFVKKDNQSDILP